MKRESMILLGLLLVVLSFVTLANRKSYIDGVYSKAATELKAKMAGTDFDQDALQEEARAIEARVVRVDESIMYGGALLGLLGLVLFHAGLVRPAEPKPVPQPTVAVAPVSPVIKEEEMTEEEVEETEEKA